MTNYNDEKITQIVLYALQQTGGMDYYHLFKILYFAEKSHLVKWGSKIICDDFCALKYGPVPTRLYNAIKKDASSGSSLISLLDESVGFAGEDAPNVLVAKQQADMDFISQSEKEAIDASIEENLHLSFDQLCKKSHDAAWRESYYSYTNKKTISPVSMAVTENADAATLNYIKEMLELEEAFA